MRSVATIVAVLFAGASVCVATPGDEPAETAPERIVSMAPSTTEILFALGLGERVVGVTRYCDFPEAARELPAIGGYMDPAYERIVALEPDLVVLLDSHQRVRRDLEKLDLRTLAVPHHTIDEIHAAIRSIGAACGAEASAVALTDELRRRREVVRRAVEGRRRPRVLMCIGRDTASDELAGIYVAGHDGLYDSLIELAGGRNVYPQTNVSFPQVSAEGLIRLDPDVIVDLAGPFAAEDGPGRATTTPWERLSMVRAVRHGRVYTIPGTRALRPGPRYVDVLEKLARLLHPEAFAEERDDD